MLIKTVLKNYGIFLKTQNKDYFLLETKSAKSQPTKVQPNNQEPTRTRILSYLEELLTIDKYAGVNIKHIIMNMTPTYFKTSKILIPCHIFKSHIWHCFPVLLRFELIGYILPYGLCAT